MEHSHFIIIDDFLSQASRLSLYEYFTELDFVTIHSKKKIKTFKISDGAPLWSDPILSHDYSQNVLYPVYPTGKIIDIFIAEVIRLTLKKSSFIGAQGQDWEYFFARPYIYPAGSGLSWHSDGSYSAPGAFVYYLHPDWDPNWGGELLLSCSKINDVSKTKPSIKSNWDNDPYSEAIMSRGIGHYI